MPPRTLPRRSDSPLRGGPPADSSKPDHNAVTDVFEKVEETGSLEAAARQLQSFSQGRRWEDDPEEADFKAQGMHDADDGDEVAVQDVEHLQEVIDGLWLGDLVAAMDTQGLEERGIVRRFCSGANASPLNMCLDQHPLPAPSGPHFRPSIRPLPTRDRGRFRHRHLHPSSVLCRMDPRSP